MIPKKTGLIHYNNIDLREIVPFIHWTFFFMAWRLNGKYDDIDKMCDCGACETGWLQKFPIGERAKAEEAIKLYKDAREMLVRFRDEKIITINASVAIFPAHSDEDDIIINLPTEKVCIPTLRQQKPSSDGFCYSLADFLLPTEDYMGVFANTVLGGEEYANKFEEEDDMYNSILIKTLCDRIAEATAEWLHYKIRTEIWGYAPNEKLDVNELFKTHYQGIRPAVGYPSLPDQSIIFRMNKILPFENLGIKLTENGAMYPNASVSGLVFAHPKSKYFNIGKIDEEQLLDYAKRSDKPVSELKKWLAANL